MSGGLVLVAGAGDVGARLAALRLAGGDEVLCLRRSAAEPPPGARALRADLASGEGLGKLPRRAEAIVFCAAPDKREESAYRALYLDGLRRLLDAVEAPRFVFVSSTAVYAEDAGEWVDENTPPRPPAFNGRVLLAAEQRLADLPGTVALRLSGLYGPGREMMLRKARAGEPGRRHWTNRIHVDDAASALSRLLDEPRPRPLYLGSDDHPAREADVLAWLREREGLPPVPGQSGPDSGRRVRNRRLRELGWSPRFPDFRSGYGAMAGPGV